jgi:aryl-alcohol dehydrogenase-like predicted oxidoreductase
MERVKLGQTPFEISRVGLGTWAIGGGEYQSGWGPQDDEASVAAIHAALGGGINWIDTAAVYGLGRAESVLRVALEGLTDRPFIFTKCSQRWTEDRVVYSSLKRDSILEEVEGSLTRLGVDRLDLYQLHRPWPEEDLEEGWTTLADLQAQGVVGAIGVSQFSLAQLEIAGSIAKVDTLQPKYSLIDRTVEAEILPYCAEHGIGVITYSPMGSGLLTGAMSASRVANLPPDDWRGRSPEFRGPQLQRHLRVAERLAAIGQRLGCSPGAVAVAWVLANPAVAGAIVGFRSAAQVAPLLSAPELRLDSGVLAELDEVTGGPG